ncbi:MAG TPA: phospholipase A [Sphingomonas sp.]|nr:phospholipase A [Sphingomonas sp.]
MKYTASIPLLLLCPTGAIAATSPPPVAWQSVPPALEQVVSGVREAEGGGTIIAHILLLNASDDRTIDAPDRLDATLHAGGRDTSVRLALQAPSAPIAPHGWTVVDYSMDKPVGMTGAAVLSLGDGPQGYAFALTEGATPTRAVASTSGRPPRTEREAGTQSSVVFGNLMTYRPVYVVSGSGTNDDIKIQLSFQYQLFGHADEPAPSWLDGFRFAYTEIIYWDATGVSQPFRDVSYEPELFYLYRWRERANGLRFSARGGFLHESNGKGVRGSRAVQYLYVEPQVDIPLGSYTLSVGPRLFHYVLGRDMNQDIARYRGHQALELSIGRDDGLKLSTFIRYNFRTGKGSVDGDLTYPVRRLIGHTPLYLVVQGATGYGEDLRDYNRRQSRIRVGVGIIR